MVFSEEGLSLESPIEECFYPATQDLFHRINKKKWWGASCRKFLKKGKPISLETHKKEAVSYGEPKNKKSLALKKSLRAMRIFYG